MRGQRVRSPLRGELDVAQNRSAAETCQRDWNGARAEMEAPSWKIVLEVTNFEERRKSNGKMADIFYSVLILVSERIWHLFPAIQILFRRMDVFVHDSHFNHIRLENKNIKK